MSLDATKWAWTVCALPKTHPQYVPTAAGKLVLLSLADRARDSTWRCWPSIRRIAKDTGLSTATVQDALHKLEERRLLMRSAGDRKTTNEYVLTVEGVSETDTGLCQSSIQGVSVLRETCVTPRHKTRKELSKNRGAEIEGRRDYDNSPSPRPDQNCPRCHGEGTVEGNVECICRQRARAS